MVSIVAFVALAGCGSTPGASAADGPVPEKTPGAVAGRSFIGTGNDCLRAGNYACAVENYERAIEQRPESGAALTNLAWILATAPDATFRDGARAITLAEAAVSNAERTGDIDGNLGYLVALAAAYAEAGRYDDAVMAMDRVIEIATKRGARSSLMQRYEGYRSAFRDRNPWRFTPDQD